MAGAISSKIYFLAEYEAEQNNQHMAHEQAQIVIGAKRPRMMHDEAIAIKKAEEFGKLLASTVGEEQANYIHAVDVHVGEAGISQFKEKAADPLC